MGGDAGPAAAPPCRCLPRALSSVPADAGAPVYFYEFQHRPDCFKDTKPAFVKADHSDEIRFVFGGAFLKGDVIFGKEMASRPLLLLEHWGDQESTGRPPVCMKPSPSQLHAGAGGLVLIYLFDLWFTNDLLLENTPHSYF